MTKRGWLTLLTILLVIGLLGAEEPPAGAQLVAEAGVPPMREVLDGIREDVVAARFEKALASIDALLDDPALARSDRAELLSLRAETHVALGDLEAAEKDYRQILLVRPSYEPDSSLTPKVVMDRFEKIQAELVGRVRLEIDPHDAHLFVGDEEVPVPTDGVLRLLAGEHRLRAEHDGFDPVLETLTVAAGKQTELTVQLVPNSRTIVLRTEPDGVEVLLDGQSVGVTARPAGWYGGTPPPAELLVENVPLGEHRVELIKECFRRELLTDNLTVDLLQRTPKKYETVSLVEARSTVDLQNGLAGAKVSVDRRQVATLPASTLDVCPGSRLIEVRFGGRVIYSGTEEFREAVHHPLDVASRPNAALVGATEWPSAFRSYADGFNTVDSLPLPAGADLSTALGWSGVELPAGIDLALGVVPPKRQGLPPDWYLYSPILRAVLEIDATPTPPQRPTWSVPVWGFSTVDTEIGGPTRVVMVRAGGPAESLGLVPGDRILSVGGRPVAGTAELGSTLEAASIDRPVDVEWRSVAGETVRGQLQGQLSPRLVVEHAEIDLALTRAAWAVLDSIVSPEEAPAATANLALLFAEFGHHDLAAETWRRVRWGNRPGIGEGTTQYYLGTQLQQLGEEAAAVKAYRAAAQGAATALYDEGPPVRQAALDRLADLGKSTNATSR